ncbi:MAG: MBL fold metallo-hydrolase [Sphingobacteriales bacterium]|nr:MAG: MBL fold metallo-hydrolase [Sphingobacteriales bacterium]
MKISFHGAARTVTGSKHIIHFKNGKKLLLDCGMFQGMGKDTVRLNSNWGFDPMEITHVVLSHAHIDHSGLLPKLVKDGYKGRIYCTPGTADLVRILLLDSAYIQEADIRFANKRREKEGRNDLIEPLYTVEDAQDVFPLLEIVPYGQTHRIDEDIDVTFTDCGHIVGSAAINLRLKEKDKKIALTFSGDIGRYGDLLLRSPEVFPQADFIIMESTYGDKLHDLQTTAIDKFAEWIEETCLRKKGKLIVPAFSLGRTQEILYLLNRLELENRLPKVDYFVDSPLSTKITQMVKSYVGDFNKDVQKMLERDEDVFDFKGLKFTEGVEDSMALNESTQPCVIVSASGMAEAGRIKHHIAHNISDPKNTILFTGYCEPHSLGGKLKEGASEVRIFGHSYDVKAEVASIDTLSAHGDYEDMSQWLACQDKKRVQKIYLVHGEYDVQQAFRQRLIRKGYSDVEIPDMHQEFGLGI